MSETYDIHPTDADLDDETLYQQFEKHSGDDTCGKCHTTGAHHIIRICDCCGKLRPHVDFTTEVE